MGGRLPTARIRHELRLSLSPPPPTRHPCFHGPSSPKRRRQADRPEEKSGSPRFLCPANIFRQLGRPLAGGPSRGVQESDTPRQAAPNGPSTAGTSEACIPMGASACAVLPPNSRSRRAFATASAPDWSNRALHPDRLNGIGVQTSSLSDQSGGAVAPNSRHDDQGGAGTARGPFSAHREVGCSRHRLDAPTSHLSQCSRREHQRTHTPH